MSVLVYSETVYRDYVKRVYQITLTDNLGVEYVSLSQAYNVLSSDDGSTAEAKQLANMKQQEVQLWINEMRELRDPAHIGQDGDTWFIHSIPLWNTWEECCYPAVTFWLQKEYMQDIHYCNLTCSRLTNGELADIAGQPNDVRSEQQIAVNAQAVLDAYVPLIDKDGNPRP